MSAEGRVQSAATSVRGISGTEPATCGKCNRPCLVEEYPNIPMPSLRRRSKCCLGWIVQDFPKASASKKREAA